MLSNIIHLQETTSTNDFLRTLPTPPPDTMTVATADYQTAGRGQGSNTWESEPGKNLLFSILTSPKSVPINRQFVLSMAGALAIKAALDSYCDGISLKWPNDIYWRDRKLSGTLIETSVTGKTIARCIYGIGLNVNQQVFRSNAPNPVSLQNITGHETPLSDLLDSIIRRFAHYYCLAANLRFDTISDEYHSALYRHDGQHPYEDCRTGERFEASISRIDLNGLLHLTDTDGHERTYTLKEVKFVI